MLTMLDTFLQMADFDMNMRQVGNGDIMRALEHQNTAYLEKIISNQNEIMSILSQIDDMSAK